jgi:membrane-bound lytic murein transglycosylase D
MWQFMPHGNYGLVRNAWVDERFDPKKSTEAYARYIKYLHEQFGDWYLAMAAYDWGPGNVQRAVQRTGYADFWELYRRNVLPKETKNYVPIILAAAIMAKNPGQYGLSDVPSDPPLQVDTVTTDGEVNLKLVADLVGATSSEIQQLNPALLRMSTPEGMDYDLHLPNGTGQLFEKRLAMIPEKDRKSWRFHVAAADDTVASIAEHFHVTRQKLEAANDLTAGDPIQAGQPLVIPVAPRPVRSEMRYRIRRGDTLGGIAHRFGVTVSDLRRWNHMRSNVIVAGRHLYVMAPVRRLSSREEASSGSGEGYRIRRGDTLGGIAAHFGVSVADLRRWNGIHGNEIIAGQVLHVADPPRSTHHLRRERASSGSYRIQRGDTLSGIADHFDVSVADLRRWNHIRGNEIVAGDTMRVSR